MMIRAVAVSLALGLVLVACGGEPQPVGTDGPVLLDLRGSAAYRLNRAHRDFDMRNLRLLEQRGTRSLFEWYAEAATTGTIGLFDELDNWFWISADSDLMSFFAPDVATGETHCPVCRYLCLPNCAGLTICGVSCPSAVSMEEQTACVPLDPGNDPEKIWQVVLLAPPEMPTSSGADPALDPTPDGGGSAGATGGAGGGGGGSSGGGTSGSGTGGGASSGGSGSPQGGTPTGGSTMY